MEIVADRASETLQKSLEAYATALLAKLPAEGETKDQAALFPKEGLALDTRAPERHRHLWPGGFEQRAHRGIQPEGAAKPRPLWPQRDTPEQAQAEAKRYLDFLAANGYQKVQAPGPPGTSRCSSWITRLK